MGIRRGSISTPIIADGLVFNIDAANRASTIPSTTTTKTFNTVDTSNIGSFQDNTQFNETDGIKSFQFDGVDDYIDVPTTDNINFTSAFTFSIWFKTTSAASMITSHGTSSIKYFIQWTGSSNRIRLRIYDGTNTAVTIDNFPSQDFDDGNWHHLAFTTDGTTSSNKVIIYLNGQELSNKGTLANTGIKSVTGSMKIGALNDGSNAFDGNIGPVHAYNRALSANEILHNYNSLKSRFE